jgi:hypothetical protein
LVNLWNAYFRAAQAGLDAYAVIAMRLMRLAAGGALAQREAQRMVAEKVGASFTAQSAAAAAMMQGRGPKSAANAAANIYRRTVRANRRRLGRR